MLRRRILLPLVLALCVALSIAGPLRAADFPECSDGLDNNVNSLIDLVDPYCKSADDDDESTFGSGIPGADENPLSHLDCWYDSDSGTGNDDCDRHACCGIGSACPADLDPELFDSEACSNSQSCVDFCQPLAGVDCDCFGCCSLCVPGSATCRTVYLNPAVSPTCTLDSLTDAASCRPCQIDPTCAGPLERLFSDGFESGETCLWMDDPGSADPCP
jgi:hypothetical protein